MANSGVSKSWELARKLSSFSIFENSVSDARTFLSSNEEYKEVICEGKDKRNKKVREAVSAYESWLREY